MISLLAFLFAVCSAIAWYGASPHCMWRALRGHPRVMRSIGSVFALLSLWTWIATYGVAVGLCAMLASVMLVLVVLPYLALFTGGIDTAEKG